MVPKLRRRASNGSSSIRPLASVLVVTQRLRRAFPPQAHATGMDMAGIQAVGVRPFDMEALRLLVEGAHGQRAVEEGVRGEQVQQLHGNQGQGNENQAAAVGAQPQGKLGHAARMPDRMLSGPAQGEDIYAKASRCEAFALKAKSRRAPSPGLRPPSPASGRGTRLQIRRTDPAAPSCGRGPGRC